MKKCISLYLIGFIIILSFNVCSIIYNGNLNDTSNQTESEYSDKEKTGSTTNTEELQNPETSSPTDITFSTSSSVPTPISVNTYYRTTQDATLYIQVVLNAGEFYHLNTGGWAGEVTLYEFSSFTGEIKYTADSFNNDIIYAPSTTKTYYIKWVVVSPYEKFIGVWSAIKYSQDDVTSGINLVFHDSDWGQTVIHFVSPNTDAAEDQYDIEFEFTSSTPNYNYHTMSASSDEAYNTNELKGSATIKADLYNNGDTGFLFCSQGEGTLKIGIKVDESSSSDNSLSSSSSSPEAVDMGFILIVAVVVIGIISLASFFYVNSRYLKLGHRIMKKYREKSKIRQDKREIFGTIEGKFDEWEEGVKDGKKKKDKIKID